MYVVYQLSFEAAHYSVEISNVSSLQIFTGSKLSPELIPSFLATAAPMNKSSTAPCEEGYWFGPGGHEQGRGLDSILQVSPIESKGSAEGDAKKQREGLSSLFPTTSICPT